MQPVNSNRIQNQVIPVKHGISGQRETSPYPVKTPQRGDTFILPEDVVNLSTNRALIQDSLTDKKPSVPVSQAERKALRDSFSVYV